MSEPLETFRLEILRRRVMSAAAAERLQRDADANRGAVIACDDLLAKLDAQIRAASGGPDADEFVSNSDQE